MKLKSEDTNCFSKTSIVITSIAVVGVIGFLPEVDGHIRRLCLFNGRIIIQGELSSR